MLSPTMIADTLSRGVGMGATYSHIGSSASRLSLSTLSVGFEPSNPPIANTVPYTLPGRVHATAAGPALREFITRTCVQRPSRNTSTDFSGAPITPSAFMGRSHPPRTYRVSSNCVTPTVLRQTPSGTAITSHEVP